VSPAFLFIINIKGTFMKQVLAIALALSLLGGTAMTQKKQPTTTKEKVSYSLGVNLGKNFKMQGIEVDQSLLMQGLKDGLAGGKCIMTDKDMESTMMAFQQEMMGKAQQKAQVDGEKNKKEGDAFLANNKKQAGVITLPSGLQYKILTMGTGPKPTATQTVKCHYRGTTIDGKEFDSSYKRGEPTEFPLDKVIPGWTEGIQLMPVGSKWQLFIPSNLGYGERGAGGSIGPNATLIFDVELIGIVK
jgi:FKBP-type peptidyl-prolyl cis-trans isomerase FklB